MKVALFSLLVLLAFQNTNAQEDCRADSGALESFVSDGCTLFINGPPDQPNLWEHCCFEHDLVYWFGGTRSDKHFADLQLRSCVKKVAGSFWADIIYSGVVLGHYSPIKFKYVWGWGWHPTRPNEPFTKSELQYIDEEIYALNLDPVYTDRFIQKYLIKQH